MSTMRQLFEESPSDVPRILSVIGATALLVYIWVTKISGKRVQWIRQAVDRATPSISKPRSCVPLTFCAGAITCIVFILPMS